MKANGKETSVCKKKSGGGAYVSHPRTEKRASILKKSCGENWKWHCHQQISQDQTEKIVHEFFGYWGYKQAE